MGKHKKSTGRSVESATNSGPDETDSLISRLLDICSQQQSTAAVNCNSLWKEHLEIRQSLDNVRTIQRPVVANIFGQPANETDEHRADRLRVMSEWCRKNGTKAAGISFVSFDTSGENCGLRTEKGCEVGDLVVCVPRRLFLSLENVLSRNEAARKMFDSDPLLKGMPNVALTMVVAIEKLKGADSFWFPYLNSMPTIYSTPLYFLVDGNEKLAEILRGSIAFEETLKLYKNIVRQYAYFHQMLSSSANFVPSSWKDLLTPGKFIFDLYLWAAVTVMTRINFVPSSDSGGDGKPANVPALLPFFDMANHSQVPPCTDFIANDDGQHAVIYASIRYQPEDQLFIYYGERKYWEFFLYNGFVYDDGRHYPSAIIKLGLPRNDRLLDLKTKALSRYRLNPSEQFCLCKYSVDGVAPFPQSMEYFAIIFCCNKEEELEAFLANQAEASQFNWGPERVMEARKFLETRLALVLRGYSTSGDQKDSTSAKGSSAGTAGCNDVEERWIGLAQAFIQGETDSLKSCINFLESQRS